MSGRSPAAQAISVLRDAYPRQDFPDRSVALYARMLADLQDDDLVAAVERLAKRSQWLPSIAEIRLEVAEARLHLPTEAEAWTLANEGRSSVSPLVRETVDALGGPWTIRHSENPTVLRAQFRDDYEQRRLKAVQAYAVTGRPLPALPFRARPEPPRPVWARWLLRQRISDGAARGVLLAPPTDEEKHDAILVLLGPNPEATPEFWAEAQRILDEASP